MTTPSLEQQRILRLVEKLLRLANGRTTEAEAESALLKAHSLLAEYDLEISDIDTYKNNQKCSERGAILKGASVPSWVAGLAGTLAKIYSTATPLSTVAGDGRSKIVFMGVEPQASIALHSFVVVYHYLVTRKYPTKTTAAVRMSYNIGFVEGLCKKLTAQWEEQQQKNANAQALVPVRSAIANAYFKDKYPRTRTTRPRSRIHDAAAYHAGKVDGANYSIAPGVCSSGNRKMAIAQ